ncbi:MAG: hypothetical protein M3377_00025 [Actinomycetota bacterium]|nr:hypothetical protein [Actinomycetota bacterium]
MNVGEKTSDADRFDGMGSNVFVTESTPAGGDLAGNYPNPAITDNAIGTEHVAPDALTGNGGQAVSRPAYDQRRIAVYALGTEADAFTLRNRRILDQALVRQEVPLWQRPRC